MISQLRVETLASHPCSFLEYKMIYCMCRVDHNKLWKVLKEMGIPDHCMYLLRNLHAGQEATVRIEHGTRDWFKMGKEYIKAIYCHPAYLAYMQIYLAYII